jgi:cell division protein FtsB
VAELTAENQALRRQLAQLRDGEMAQDSDESGPPF